MIREATAGDLDDLLALYLHLHETAVPGDSPRLRRAWAKILADGDHHILIAEEHGQPVSSCVCVIVPNLTRNARPYALIENVVTRTDRRRQGFASACLTRAVEIAREAGCYKVMLMTSAKDAETLAFYRRAGFDEAEKTAFIRRL